MKNWNKLANTVSKKKYKKKTSKRMTSKSKKGMPRRVETSIINHYSKEGRRRSCTQTRLPRHSINRMSRQRTGTGIATQSLNTRHIPPLIIIKISRRVRASINRRVRVRKRVFWSIKLWMRAINRLKFKRRSFTRRRGRITMPRFRALMDLACK